MRRIAVACVAGALATAPTGGVALASGETPDDTAAGVEPEPVVLVLDASGSMLEADAGGGATRMEAAKEAVRDLIGATPAGAELGVLVYGSEVGNSEAEKEAGCQDIVTLADVGPIDKDALTARVGQVSASGWTPIGTSLERAADALPDGGSVVLVSDGIDTCAPPEPCEVAEGLSGSGIDLTVHTVGFRVDAAARAQLQCIAEATGGSYADAADAGQLTEQMSVQVQRAMRSYVPAGRPITGGADAASAVDVTEGDYVVQLSSADGRTPDRAIQHFRVPMREGEVLHAAASLIRPQGGGSATDHAAIKVTQLGDDRSCPSAHDTNNGANIHGGPPTAVLSTAPAEADDACFPAGYAVFSVERSGSVAEGEDLPVELAIRVEQPVDPATIEAAPAVDVALPEITEADTRTATAVTPGLNYSTATPLEPGTYASEIVSGEFHVYAVHLEPGQRLAAAVSPTSGLGRNAGVQLNMAAPDRTALPMTESSSGYRRGSFSFQIKDGEVHADRMRATISPAASDGPHRAGDYFLMVSLENPENPASAVPYTLKVAVAGDPVPAPTPLPDPEPLTEAGRAAATAADDAAGADDTTDQAAGTGAAGQDAGDDGDPDEDAAGDAADTTGEVADGGPDALVWLLAGGGLVLLLGGGWLLSTRH